MRTLAFAATLIIVAAPALAQTPAAAPVVAAERAFASDFPAMGLAGSFSKWSEPGAIVLAEGRARTTSDLFADAPRIRQPGEPLIEWWPTFAGIAMSGDLGFTTGPAARDQEGYGHYFTVWRRQADGAWLWVYDGGSNASPAGQPGRNSEPLILPVATIGSASSHVAMTEVAAVEAEVASLAKSDQKAAHLSRMADDGRLYVAPLPPAQGRAAFADALDGWPATFDFGLAEGGGSSSAGDMVWTYGPAAWTRDGVARRGHYVRVWQKRADGWRMALAQLIPAPANPPPPAGS